MIRSSPQCLAVVLLLTADLLGVSNSQIYTSTWKVQDMIEQEEQTLSNLYAAISNLGNDTASNCFSKFYQIRLAQIKETQIDPNLEGVIKHPNSIYHIIKKFATEYQPLRTILGSASPDVQKHLSSVADMTDLRGSRLSFLRLQTVYNLSASDMIRGDYLGFMGPELSGEDALEIAEVAFKEGNVRFATAWLYEALARTTKTERSIGLAILDDTIDPTGRIYALLGRNYIRQGDQEKAAEMYSMARSSDPSDSHVIELARELESKPEFTQPLDENSDFKRLCAIQNKMTQNKFDRRLVCSYKMVILPYYRFKVELVSVSPYVALFYEVITDFEGKTIINAARANLKRGRIESDAGQSITQESRTSDLSFVYDYASPVIAGMSKKVAAITNLNTKPYVDGSDYSCEPFQVVNYGMGGHYAMHLDAFKESYVTTNITFKLQSVNNRCIAINRSTAPRDEASLLQPDQEIFYKFGGNRLATFLIYLTDVERGGSTVFPHVDLAITPIKGMALFWYTYTPSGTSDYNTFHAGCPVVYGHKWVSNKWMWLHGNAFTRRCGLKKEATQLDIDKYMRREWA